MDGDSSGELRRARKPPQDLHWERHASQHRGTRAKRRLADDSTRSTELLESWCGMWREELPSRATGRDMLLNNCSTNACSRRRGGLFFVLVVSSLLHIRRLGFARQAFVRR